MDYFQLSSNIKKLRVLKELNQQVIADHLGISLRTYNDLENNPKNLTIEYLNNIAEILETTPEQLMQLDVSQAFNNSGGFNGQNNFHKNVYNTDPEVIKEIYEKFIIELKEEIVFLREQIRGK